MALRNKSWHFIQYKSKNMLQSYIYNRLFESITLYKYGKTICTRTPLFLLRCVYGTLHAPQKQRDHSANNEYKLIYGG